MISKTNRKTFKINSCPNLHIEPSQTISQTQMNIIIRPMLAVVNCTVQREKSKPHSEINKWKEFFRHWQISFHIDIDGK